MENVTNDIYGVIDLVKYILIVTGIVGLVCLLWGIYRKERSFITRGGYVLIFVIVLWVCGYFIVGTTIDRVNDKLHDAYMEYGY